jgi:hypothetical protein
MRCLIRSNMHMVSPGGRHEVWYIIDAKYHRVMGQKSSRKNRLFPGLERQGSFVPKLQPNNGVVSCSQSKYSVVFFEGGTTTTPRHRRLSNPQPLWVTTGLDVHDSTHTTGLEPPSMQYNNDRRKLLHLRIKWHSKFVKKFKADEKSLSPTCPPSVIDDSITSKELKKTAVFKNLKTHNFQNSKTRNVTSSLLPNGGPQTLAHPQHPAAKKRFLADAVDRNLTIVLSKHCLSLVPHPHSHHTWLRATTGKIDRNFTDHVM